MTQPQLTVHQDGSWFRVDDKQSVDLRSRARYRVLLQMLVREHLRDPAATISVAAVIREVWPDERLRHTVARNRAYVALCSLRKWGLEGLVLRTQQGYQLDPKLCVTLVDYPAVDARAPGPEHALIVPRECSEAAAARDADGVSDGASFVEPGVFTAEPARHEERTLGEHREPHSMRVRLVEMAGCDDPRESLARLVG